MTKELYVVTFSSANYAGAPEHCRVWAYNEFDAILEASYYAEEFYYEQDSDQYQDENDEEPDCYASVDSAVLQEGSEFEEYIKDPKQAQAFYPIVN